MTMKARSKGRLTTSTKWGQTELDNGIVLTWGGTLTMRIGRCCSGSFLLSLQVAIPSRSSRQTTRFDVSVEPALKSQRQPYAAKLKQRSTHRYIGMKYDAVLSPLETSQYGPFVGRYLTTIRE
jgi:hypothetical protein